MAESFTSSSTWTGPVRPPSTSALRVAVRTLGCKVNRVESEQFTRDLLASGYLIVAEEDAQIVVINTCAVTAEAERKARKAARHVAALPNEPLVVLTGCAATIAPERMEALHPRVSIVVDKDAVVEQVALLAEENPELKTSTGEVSGPGDDSDRSAIAVAPFRTRHLLKIEDGCDSFCTYCIVPYARGGPRSVPLEQLRRQAEECVAAGVREIVLTGINIGRYACGDATLPDAIAAVAASGVERVRLSSVEPLDIGERLLAVLGEHSSTCRHLHVPLQSGSDHVLHAMGRRYDVAEFEARIASARLALPGLVVTTDVMVGFPGESEEDAELTRAACERIGFTKLHVFRYSLRPGTAAAASPGRLDPEVIKERANMLADVGERLSSAYLVCRQGGEAGVLIESISQGTARGTTEDYLHVRLPSAGVEVGQIVAVALVAVSNGEMYAEPV